MVHTLKSSSCKYTQIHTSATFFMCIDPHYVVQWIACSPRVWYPRFIVDPFESQSGQTKDYEIGNFCFSAKNAALRSKKKTDWLKIRIMCSSGATYLPATFVYFAYFLILFWVRVHMTTSSMD